MSTFKKLIPFILLGILIIWAISAQRGMVTKDEACKKSWGNVESQYQRRLDLFENLVSTVKNYADYEKEVMIKVTEARASVGSFKLTPEVLKDPQAMERFNASQNMLVGAMKSILAIQEKYPDLKANENFLRLQDEIAGTENRVNIARTDYNGVVGDLNSSIRRFPNNLFSGLFGVKERGYFEAEKGADKAPKVNDMFKK
jgi:LemA protein